MAKKDKDVEVKQDVPKTPEQPSSNINRYFTKEVLAQMAEMSAKEMENVLKEMIDTRQFIAMTKYTSMRTPLLDMTLRGTNPVIEPHKISWAQGAMAGLNDLESYIIDLNAPKPPEEQEESSEVSGDSSTIIG